MANLCIIATGGTIDKIHDPISEQLVFGNRSHIQDMLSLFRVDKLHYEVLMLKDSLDITDEDRDLIVETIENRLEDRIVITHGTSTMCKTGSYIKERIYDKTIILTGAMRPFSLFQSDGEFNLGCAITAAQTLDHGVYITMNGHILNPDKAAKNKNTGVFEAIQ